MRSSYRTYQWLSGRPFDLIFAGARRSPLYYPLLAKRQGIDFRGTTFCSVVTALTESDLSAEGRFLDGIDHLIDHEIERATIVRSDAVIAADGKDADWLRGRDQAIPAMFLLAPTAGDPDATAQEWRELLQRLIATRTRPPDDRDDRAVARDRKPLVSACRTGNFLPKRRSPA